MLGWLRRVIVGLLALVGLLVVLVVGGLYLLSDHLIEQYESRWQAPELPPRMLLSLSLAGPLPEQEADPVQAILRRQQQPSLRQVLEALDRAATDPQVGGILADLSHAQLGHAQAQELHQAILRFRNAGKPAIAFADTFGEGQSGNAAYYIASAFDQIWLQPSGDIGLTGIALNFVFLREALDDLGIQPQMMRRQEYKGVVETLTERSLTPAVRENYQRIAESLHGRMIADIAARRAVEPARLRALVNEAPIEAARGLENRLVDRLGYRDEVRAAALALAGGDARPVPLGAYARHAARPRGKPAAEIALITASGPIVRTAPDGLFREDMAAANQLADALDAAVNTPSVRAILLRIDSPGGSYIASDSIWQAVRGAREAGKPVVAWMGDVAASGGYFIAMAADRIVAQPMTLTGSIGVVTLNLPKLAYLAQGEEDFLDLLTEYAELARNSLEFKRKLVNDNLERGLFPWTKRYLKNGYRAHFSTIGLVGGHEACLNLLGKGIQTDAGIRFMQRALNHLRDLTRRFQEETGIVVRQDGSGPTEGSIIAQHESGRPTWDIVDADPFSAETLGKRGMIEPIDYDVVDRGKMREGFGWEHSASTYFYSYIIAYDARRFGDNPPTGMADFFDVDKFPGPRAMRKNPVDTLEIALMADGVPHDQLYPLDLDRAFAKLDTLKPHIANWWTSPVQAVELIVNGDVNMVPVWANFPVAAIENGAPLGLNWRNNIFGVDMFTILKGSDNVEACREFIKFCVQAEQQAGVASQVAIAPTNPEAYKLIPEDRARLLASSPENAKDAVEISNDFWSANRDAISDRFNEWLLT